MGTFAVQSWVEMPILVSERAPSDHVIDTS